MRRALLSLGAVIAALGVAGVSSAYAVRGSAPVAVAPSSPGAKDRAAASPTPAPQSFSASLTGKNETPPSNSPARGTAKITVNVSKNQVCWNLTAQKLQGSATRAAIHRGPAGKSGPVVLNLSPPAGGSSHGCKNVGPPLARGLVKNPANYYVSVHTNKFPNGEIRGQL
jgi:hypothetical protein